MDFLSLEASLPPELAPRWQALLARFRELDSVIVAFSGGVDSGLLCAAAYAALGERMLAVTVRSPVESLGDVDSAQALAAQVGFSQRVIDYDDLTNPEFVANPPERCYICKLARFRLLQALAAKEGFAALVEGSNADDLGDYRPGRRAIAETGTVSPLHELGFTKSEIRALAKALGLSVWDRPSAPCLATRFPYDCSRLPMASTTCATSASRPCASAITANWRGSRSRRVRSNAWPPCINPFPIISNHWASTTSPLT